MLFGRLGLDSPMARAHCGVDVTPDLIMLADDRQSDHRICVRSIRRGERLPGARLL